jgi:hypothetical protein
MRFEARRFVPASYERNDEWGKSVLYEWLDSFGSRFIIVDKQEEDYQVDVLVIDTETNLTISFEVEVKHGYPFTDASSFKFDSVSFLGRKKKYDNFWYAIICGETKAILMAHSREIYKEEYRQVKEIATSERNGMDEFYRVPKSKCFFYAHTRT